MQQYDEDEIMIVNPNYPKVNPRKHRDNIILLLYGNNWVIFEFRIAEKLFTKCRESNFLKSETTGEESDNSLASFTAGSWRDWHKRRISERFSLSSCKRQQKLTNM